MTISSGSIIITCSIVSVETLPYVKNPNTDQVIPLNEYYDKEIESDVYELATEGKVNLKFGMRSSGSTDKGNLRLSIKYGL